MDNLNVNNSIFKITNFDLDKCHGIYVDADYRLSTGDMCYLPLKKQIVFAINNYKDTIDIELHLDELDKYKDNFCYIKMNTENLETTCLVEEEGVPYDLFEAPDHEPWCMIGYTKASVSNKIVCLPLSHRENISECKEMRSVSEHIFTQGEKVLAYTDGTFNKKPTKLSEYKFNKDGKFKSIKRTKIEEPKVNRCLNNEEGIHAFSYVEDNMVIHRLLDYKGTEIKRREMQADGIFFSASFEKNSCTILYKDHVEIKGNPIDGMNYCVMMPSEIFYIVYDLHGRKIEEKKLFELNELCYVTSITSTKLDEDTYAFNIVYGSDYGPVRFGNGWFVVSSGELKECWLQNREKNGYLDLVTGKTMRFNMENMILHKVKACGNGYAIYFDGIREGKCRNRAAVLVKNIEQFE